jgi:lipoprotein-releasing system permease protein
MLYICFLSAYISTCALALIISVMSGFKQATLKTLQGIHSDIIIQSHTDDINITALAEVLKKEFPEIVACAASDVQQGLLYNSRLPYTPTVVMIKGIDPHREGSVTCLEKTMLTHIPLEQSLDSSSVIVGYKLADLYKLQVGDSATLLVAQDQSVQSQIMKFYQEPVIVQGLIKTGIEEFDANMVICSLDFLHQKIPYSGTSFMHNKVKTGTDIPLLITALKKRTRLDVYDWKELYPAVISALQLEQYAIMLIAGLILLIASSSIIALLYMLITYKRKDIIILQMMGLSHRSIRIIFSTISILINGAGCVLGLFTAYLLGTLIDHYGLIALPDAYFVSALPVAMDYASFILIFILVMSITFLTTLFSVKLTKSYTVSANLRLEG